MKGRALGRRVLDEVAWLVTPHTILRWYRELIAAKYDGTARRGAGRPGTASSLRELVVRFATEKGMSRRRLKFSEAANPECLHCLSDIVSRNVDVSCPKRGDERGHVAVALDATEGVS